MFAEVKGMGLTGLNAYEVTVEINTAKGMASFEVIGLADLAVQESKIRITSALQNCGIELIKQRITINLAPASVKKTGSIFDLAMLVAILFVQGNIKEDISDSVFLGELSLSGSLVPVNGVLPIIMEAKKNGIKNVFLPKENAVEASVVSGISIYGTENITELIHHLNGVRKISAAGQYLPSEKDFLPLYDFADVKGQENVKRALEIAAAGFHNVLMIGPPGTGKSMAAKRLPSILSKMTFEESIETTQVHSVAAILDKANPLITTRPFREVSHTASSVGLIGGGSIPKPGEISLAHNGVLFLDEFPEFNRKVLETLRQPLENGEINISRAVGSFCYPCNIMLIAAMNPCPCGNFGHPTQVCHCSPSAVQNYLNKISQPVLDRIDIQVEVPPVTFSEISSKQKSESSEIMRRRVEKAREIQAKRFKGTDIKYNSNIPPSLLHEVCVLDKSAEEIMASSFEKLGLSGRAYDRVLKVARTIADMDGSEIIQKGHIFAAVTYRSLDRKYWKK